MVMKPFIVFASLIISFLVFSPQVGAYETDFQDLQEFDRNLAGWKLGRGISNIIWGPYELLAQVTNNSINGAYNGAYDGGLQGYLAGSLNGAVAGSTAGIYSMVKRISVGLLEVVTFWKPEYGPTMDPQWGTRNRAFTDQDYFDPDPFWYNGPPR
jgi:putative exosortase-associated protein (TIGR04073 family)